MPHAGRGTNLTTPCLNLSHLKFSLTCLGAVKKKPCHHLPQPSPNLRSVGAWSLPSSSSPPTPKIKCLACIKETCGSSLSHALEPTQGWNAFVAVIQQILTPQSKSVRHIVMGNTKSHVSGYEDGTLEINLSNFKLLRVVGKGSYGKVSSLPRPFFFIVGSGERRS